MQTGPGKAWAMTLAAIACLIAGIILWSSIKPADEVANHIAELMSFGASVEDNNVVELLARRRARM